MRKQTVNPTGTRKPKAFQDTSLARMEWEGTHADLENKNIVIHSARSIRTQYGEAFVCSIQHDDKTVDYLMGGMVLVDQIETILGDLPVLCRVEKPSHYYLLVEPV